MMQETLTVRQSLTALCGGKPQWAALVGPTLFGALLTAHDFVLASLALR